MRRVRSRKRAIATGAFILVMMLVGVPTAAAATVTVATAGDIARATIGTPQKKTADLVTAMRPAKVLVLRDAQYEQGEFSNFLQSYDPTWGVFNGIAARTRQC